MIYSLIILKGVLIFLFQRIFSVICAEYIWLDGVFPTQALRSKILVLPSPRAKISLGSFPDWSFDGSSTSQAKGSDSDLYLKPVQFFSDPIRGEGNFLVMCEVFLTDGLTPHKSNQRSRLRDILEKKTSQAAWIGFEQEYTLFENERPLGWPEEGFPTPQGPFYCGVGSSAVAGRELVELHLRACMESGIYLCGVNAEVMLGQWEFQIGHRGFEGELADPLVISDQLWIARWLLYRIAEEFNIHVSFENKPIKGDWNGAGMHTNFSTLAMRQQEGIKEINVAIKKLSKTHKEHIVVYGDKLEERLTGLHETCNINEFKSGHSDRGASIRIPAHVVKKGSGYLEDRRPGANADPYVVSHRLIQSICS